MNIIADMRYAADNPDSFEHDYPAIIHRFADRLIAAGCLVPVKVGEPCRFDDMIEVYIMFCGNIYNWLEIRRDGTTARPIYGGQQVGVVVSGSTIVQPVRLVPIAEVVE